jgi:hypothetical protein
MTNKKTKKQDLWQSFLEQFENDQKPILDEFDEALMSPQEKQSIYQTEVAMLKYKIKKIQNTKKESSK